MPNLRSFFSMAPREYVDQYRRFSSSFPISTRTGESMGLGGFVGRAASVALGYGILGPRLFGDSDLEFAEKRRKAVERLDESEARVIALEKSLRA